MPVNKKTQAPEVPSAVTRGSTDIAALPPDQQAAAPSAPTPTVSPDTDTLPVLGMPRAEPPTLRRSQVSEDASARHVIALDRTGERGTQCYVDVEPFGDPALYASYLVYEVPDHPEFLDVNVNGDWVRLSVEEGPLIVTAVEDAEPVASPVDPNATQ